MTRKSDQASNLVVGPYRITIPEGAGVDVQLSGLDSRHPQAEITTTWTVYFEGFQFIVRLDPRRDPDYLTTFVFQQTRVEPNVSEVCFNGVRGITCGEIDSRNNSVYVDWWLKRGGMMLCITLRGVRSARTSDIKQAAERMLNSVEYLPGAD